MSGSCVLRIAFSRRCSTAGVRRCWRLSTSYIKGSCGTLQRFQEHSNEYPRTWSAHHVDEFLADRRSSENGLALSTLRANSGAIRAFCSYLTDGRSGWAAFCERVYADIPVQVVFEWNSPRHSTDDAMPPHRRAFTRTELQTFFDAADDLIDADFAEGSKRWLPALRGSTAFKVAYGLRRRELTMLEYVDFGPNPHAEQFGRVGLQVRWAKGTKGFGPRRRTVLTVPEVDWVVGQLEHWLSPDGRKRFQPRTARPACGPRNAQAPRLIATSTGPVSASGRSPGSPTKCLCTP